MVATASQAPAPQPSEEDAPDFSRYDQTIDPHLCAPDGFGDGIDRNVPFVLHECFQQKPRLNKAKLQELRVKQVALRIAAGLELRSLRDVAKEIGVHHNTVDKALLTLCDRIGIRKFIVSDSTRKKQSDARRRSSQSATS